MNPILKTFSKESKGKERASLRENFLENRKKTKRNFKREIALKTCKNLDDQKIL